ncbi:MAG: polyhydroxybutyrate depolymerase [Rhizobiales bacterium]|nr:polyhydroxybutyrate depolymerase [Hyphomicrobiales bacterium]
MRMVLLIALFAALTALSALPAAAQSTPCGKDAPCAAGEGEVAGDYYLSFPRDWDGTTPLPALLYFHAHRSSGLSALKSARLARTYGDNGYLIIAPNGAPRAGDGVRGWAARPDAIGRRDDLPFIDAVMEDVASKVPLQRDKVLVAGFSSGGSMVWMLACYQGPNFAGYVSIAGALRRPAPDGPCPGGPFRMLHIHGFADTTVPLEGRGIREWHQGDVFESLSILRKTNVCRSKPSKITKDGAYGCRIWRDCGSGREIQFCLHDGGHKVPKGWAERARAWFETETGGS